MKCFDNRELSWLKFNERVLEEAADERVPLAERLTFLSIFQSNLDEFFMVRVGSLLDLRLVDKEMRENKTNMTADEQLERIYKAARRLNDVKGRYYEALMEKIAWEGVRLINFRSLSLSEADYLENYFEAEIKPLLSIIIVNKKQPFPFLSNKSIYAIAHLKTKGDKDKIGIVPCNTGVFDRLIEIPGRMGTYMLAEELILHFIPNLFASYRIQEKSLIRITRNADIDADSIYDEDLNYRDHMSEIVKLRRKLSPVRMEYTRDLDMVFLGKICDYMSLSKEQCYKYTTPLDLSFVSGLQNALKNKKDLFYPKRVPQKSRYVDEGRSIIEQILEKDILLSYPYESIKPFLTMLQEAAADPDVVSIKMTLYRLAEHSKVIEALTEAAENGKQVDVLVELKARFDEENNIEWSRLLEDAGCHVIYGVDGLKVHSKVCLITRRSGGNIQYITQIGTGNYNEKTSRLYTDLSLMTANQDIGMEAAALFQSLSLGETVDETKHLLIAPRCLQNKIIAMIDEEIKETKRGGNGYIGIKINSFTDKKILDKIIEASDSGVQIEMVVRGICCLIPGIEGCTENVRIISIVGRFLEHSRIYMFGRGERERLYIASADFMTRNTCRRVEAAIPVYDEEIKERITEMFVTMLSDTEKARELGPDGIYRRVPSDDAHINSQEYFYAEAYGENI